MSYRTTSTTLSERQTASVAAAVRPRGSASDSACSFKKAVVSRTSTLRSDTATPTGMSITTMATVTVITIMTTTATTGEAGAAAVSKFSMRTSDRLSRTFLRGGPMFEAMRFGLGRHQLQGVSLNQIVFFDIPAA